MRKYLSVKNLEQALILASVCTVMSIPRMSMGKMPLQWCIPSAVCCLTLVAGAATAWGKYAGLPGIFPTSRRSLVGVLAAILLGLVFVPVRMMMDPTVKEIFARDLTPEAMSLIYPTTLTGCVALVLWAASFGVLFFQAGTISFLARLTGRRSIAVAGSVALRLYVMHMKMASREVESLPFMLAGTTIVGLVTAMLYIKGGLPAAMAFAATVDSRHFLLLAGEE